MSEDAEKAGEANEVVAAADSGAAEAAAEAPPDDGEKAAAAPPDDGEKAAAAPPDGGEKTAAAPEGSGSEVNEPAAEPDDSAQAAVPEDSGVVEKENSTKLPLATMQPPAVGDDDPLADFFSSRPKDGTDQKEETVKAAAEENGELEEASKPCATEEPRARSSKRSSSASRSHKRGRSSTRSRSRRSRHSRRDKSHSKGNTLEDFIKENMLDDKCARVMREMDPTQSKAVMDQGFDVRHCRNPSAVVMSRVQKLERERAPPRKRSFSPRRDASPRRRRSRSRKSRSPSYSSYSSSRPRERSRRKRKHRHHHKDRRHKHKRRH